MDFNSLDRKEWVLNRSYNVEYKLGNGELKTLNNKLVGISEKYLWFLSEREGLDLIKIDRIATMISTERRIFCKG